MLKYVAQLNLGNAALGSERSISANEVCETVDAKYISEEINHIDPLVPPKVAEQVLGDFCEAVARLMGMGFDVVNIGLASTPTTEIAVTMEGACGGIIITASHNFV